MAESLSPLQRRVATVRKVLLANMDRIDAYVGSVDAPDLTNFFAMPANVPVPAPEGSEPA